MNDTAVATKPLTTSKTPSRKLLIWTTIIFVPVGVLGVPGSYASLFMFDQEQNRINGTPKNNNKLALFINHRYINI
jgi:hypothetical protein